jgi:hypothetical protein
VIKPESYASFSYLNIKKRSGLEKTGMRMHHMPNPQPSPIVFSTLSAAGPYAQIETVEGVEIKPLIKALWYIGVASAMRMMRLN